MNFEGLKKKAAWFDLFVECLRCTPLSTATATSSPTPTLPSQTPTQPPTQTATSPITGPPLVAGGNAGAIAGGVIGGLIGVAIIVLIIIVIAYLVWRWKDSPSKCNHCYHWSTCSVHMYVHVLYVRMYNYGTECLCGSEPKICMWNNRLQVKGRSE